MSLQLAIALMVGGEFLIAAALVGLVTLLLRLMRSLDAAGGDDPGWWPEFEREFAEHVARRRRQADVP